jgi:hypothetical protein
MFIIELIGNLNSIFWFSHALLVEVNDLIIAIVYGVMILFIIHISNI